MLVGYQKFCLNILTWSWNVSLSLLTNCLCFVIFFQACSTTAKDILPQLKSSLTLPSTIVPSCLWIERIKSKLRAEYETEGWDTGCDVINLQNHGRKKNFATRLPYSFPKFWNKDHPTVQIYCRVLSKKRESSLKIKINRHQSASEVTYNKHYRGQKMLQFCTLTLLF